MLADLLCASNLQHLEPTLCDFDLAAAAAVLEQSGRPKLLAHLKAAGVAKLSDRQALGSAISKALKAGEIQAVATDPAGRLNQAAARGDVDGVRDALAALSGVVECDGRAVGCSPGSSQFRYQQNRVSSILRERLRQVYDRQRVVVCAQHPE